MISKPVKIFATQIETVQQEIEATRKDATSKKEDYNRKKLMLQSVLSPEIFRVAEQYIENGSTERVSSWDEPMSSNTFNMPTSASTNSVMIHKLVDLLMRCEEPAPAPSKDVLLHKLNSRVSNNETSDILDSLFDIFRNKRSSDSRPAPSVSGRSYAENGPSTSRAYDGPTPMDTYDITSYENVQRYSANNAGPSRQYHPGVLENVSMPNGSMANGVMPPGNMPPGSMPAGVMGPGGSMQPGSMPPGSMPPGCMPAPPAVPSQAVYLPGGMPSAPPASAPSVFMPGPYHSMPTGPAVPFHAQMQYNGPSPHGPGGMPQQVPRPPMPPQNNYFLGGRYPNQSYYPPY